MSKQQPKRKDKISQPIRKAQQSAQPSQGLSFEALAGINKTALREMNIPVEGAFLPCANSKEALDVINHIKVVLRTRGFGCYALHNFVWIVPFIHREIHIPDFARAKSVLPDLKADLLNPLISPEDRGDVGEDDIEAQPSEKRAQQAKKLDRQNRLLGKKLKKGFKVIAIGLAGIFAVFFFRIINVK